MSVIRIVNARQNNLQGITVELPHRALTVITGPSGSGKSSLAFDTLYAEGQRRYIESLSTYAKQFLERMPKPLVDHLEGIAPSVAIEQRNPVISSRSTVGTATEVYDHLRLLWARVGRCYCQVCGAPVRRDTPQSATDDVLAAVPGGRILVAFPLPPVARLTHAAVVENLRALGFVRVLADGAGHHLDELPAGLDLTQAGELLVVVDRLVADGAGAGRIAESVATAFQEGEGVALVLHGPEGSGRQRLRFTRFPACSACDTPAPTVTPALFSFNNPRGACAQCNGFGAVLEYDESLVVPDPNLLRLFCNDPTAPLVARCGKRPYVQFRSLQTTRLSRYSVCFLGLGAKVRRREFMTFLGGAAATCHGAVCKSASGKMAGTDINLKLSNRRDIDGLRALSVLCVFLYHLEVPLFRGGSLVSTSFS